MFAILALAIGRPHRLERFAYTPEAAECWFDAMTTLHPALDRSSQWDRVTITSPAGTLLATWTPEKGRI